MKKTVISALTLVILAGGIWGWGAYEERYYTSTDHAHHRQCPSPFDRDIYDCELWPKQ